MRTVARWSSIAAVILALAACAPGGPPPVPTDLFVDPVGGSDAAPGTAAAPLRSLGAALALADSGMTVHLAAGTYDAANGETWPLQVGFPPVATPNVPDGVSIVGTTGVRLVGPGGATTAAALAFAGAASVSDVEVEGFERAILAWLPGPVTLTRVRATGNSVDGLLAFGQAEVLAVDSRFDANGLSGAAAFGDAVLELQGGEVDGNRTGVYATGDTTVSMMDTLVTGNGSAFEESNSGVYAIGRAHVVLAGVVLSGSPLAGLEVRGDASVVVTSGTTMSGNGFGLLVGGTTGGPAVEVYYSGMSSNGHGIWWSASGGGALVVRGSVIRSNTANGVAVYGAPDVVNLGNMGEGTGNRIDLNGVYQVHDNRPDRAAADGPIITVDFYSFVPVGCVLPNAVYTGPFSYTCDGVTALQIDGANQRVQVVSD